MKYHALFVIFEKNGKIWSCRLLQIVGGALRVKGAAWYGSILFAMKAAKVPRQTRKQTALVTNDGQRANMTVPKTPNSNYAIFFFRELTSAIETKLKEIQIS